MIFHFLNCSVNLFRSACLFKTHKMTCFIVEFRATGVFVKHCQVGSAVAFMTIFYRSVKWHYPPESHRPVDTQLLELPAVAETYQLDGFSFIRTFSTCLLTITASFFLPFFLPRYGALNSQVEGARHNMCCYMERKEDGKMLCVFPRELLKEQNWGTLRRPYMSDFLADVWPEDKLSYHFRHHLVVLFVFAASASVYDVMACK